MHIAASSVHYRAIAAGVELITQQRRVLCARLCGVSHRPAAVTGPSSALEETNSRHGLDLRELIESDRPFSSGGLAKRRCVSQKVRGSPYLNPSV